MAPILGAEMVAADGEYVVFMRCLIAVMDRLGVRELRVPVRELEAIAGKRGLTIKGEVDTVLVSALTAEEMAVAIAEPANPRIYVERKD